MKTVTKAVFITSMSTSSLLILTYAIVLTHVCRGSKDKFVVSQVVMLLLSNAALMYC